LQYEPWRCSLVFPKQRIIPLGDLNIRSYQWGWFINLDVELSTLTVAPWQKRVRLARSSWSEDLRAL
jgi:hypothetical protein